MSVDGERTPNEGVRAARDEKSMGRQYETAMGIKTYRYLNHKIT